MTDVDHWGNFSIAKTLVKDLDEIKEIMREETEILGHISYQMVIRYLATYHNENYDEHKCIHPCPAGCEENIEGICQDLIFKKECRKMLKEMDESIYQDTDSVILDTPDKRKKLITKLKHLF